MKRKVFLLQGLLSLSLVWGLLSCDAQLDDVDNESEIKLTSKLTNEATVTTRVNALDYQSTQIVEGQQVGITITGAKSEHNNVSWTVAKDGTLNNNAMPIYWASTPATITAYHPYNSTWTGNNYTFSVSTDQSNEANYRNSDLLWTSTTVSYMGIPIPLTFAHQLAKISVTLTSDDLDDLSNAIISICNTKTSVEFNPITGNLGKVTGVADIKAGVTQQNAYTASAVIVPQEIGKDVQLIKITKDGKEFYYSLPEKKTFSHGCSYHFHLKISGLNVEDSAGKLVVEGWKEDNPAIYAKGGETTLIISSRTPWTAEVTDAATEDWLELKASNNDQGNGTLLIKTAVNHASTDRVAEVKISNGTESKSISIAQLPNIITRIPSKERMVSNNLIWEYDVMNFTKLVAILPVPTSNLYQDISNWNTDDGELLSIDNNKYLRRTFVNGEFPASGNTILNETFKVRNYYVYTNFESIRTVIPIDEASDVYTKYTVQNGDIIVPDHPKIQKIANDLWSNSSLDIIEYVRNCYEYVASNMKYLNPNIGLIPLDEVLAAGGGDCGNQASVFISLLRNKKIPARHVVMIRTDGTYHVRSEFYLAGYGWIPVDVNAKNMNPSGDYFGKVESNEIVVSNDVNIKVEFSENNFYTASLLQTYFVWYWWTAPVKLNFYHKVIENK